MSPLIRWTKSDKGRKYARYSLVSLISVIVGQLTLGFAFGVLAWSAEASNYAGFIAGAVPSYWLNRCWTWSVEGRPHLLREIVPFAAMSVLGLLLSTVAVNAAESAARDASGSRAIQTAAVMAASLAAFGCIWVSKFIGMNRWLFPSAGIRPRSGSTGRP